MPYLNRITATLVDTDGNWRVYHINQIHTIRVGAYNRAGVYTVELMRGNGWTYLLQGHYSNLDDLPYPEAVKRAVAVLVMGPSEVTFLP